MHEESELVTGEAVVLDLHVAKLASRALAMVLDVLVQFALLLGTFFVLTLTVPGEDESLALTLILVFLVLIMVGYPVLFETLSRGRSLGKMAVGLRVVRVDGGPIRFRHALTRGLAGFVIDFWALGVFGAVAVIVSLCSSDGRRVGDFLAGTLVVRDRAPESVAYPAIGMPPGLEGWAARLDLTRLPDDLALASRQFLARFGQLAPEASHALGWKLAQQVGNALGTPVPPGVPPWAFLAAVLAERRNRDHARAVRAYAAQVAAARGQLPSDQAGYAATGGQAYAASQAQPSPWSAASAGPSLWPAAAGPAAASAGPASTGPGFAGSAAEADPPTPPSGTPAPPAENPFTPPG